MYFIQMSCHSVLSALKIFYEVIVLLTTLIYDMENILHNLI